MKSNLAYSPAFRMLSENAASQVWENEITGEKALISSASFQPGDVICNFGAATVLDHPTYLTIQVDINKHITLEPTFLQYVNHSCSPNVFFDTSAMQLLCLREIKQGDEMSFFYPSAEWEMDQPFACRCQSGNCLKYIRGAAHLPMDILKHYKLTGFISQQLMLHLQK